MAFVLTTPPTATAELRTVRILRLELNTGHQLITAKSLLNTIDLSK